MHRTALFWLVSIVGCLNWSNILCAQERSPGGGGSGQPILLEAFVRSDLPASTEVEKYLDELRKREHGLEIVIHDMLKDREQLVRLNELSKKFGRTKAVVPSFHCCNRMFFGFASSEKNSVDIDKLRTVDVYSRETCPRCRAAKEFISQLKVRWPGLRFEYHDVDSNAAVRIAWEQLCRGTNQVPGLPTIDFAGRVIVGYQGNDLTGAELERLIEKVAGKKSDQRATPRKSDETRRTRVLLDNQIAHIFTSLGANVADVNLPALCTAPSFPIPQVSSPPDPQLDDLALPSSVDEAEIGEGIRQFPDSEDTTTENGSIRLPYFGTINVSELGLPAFTLAVGLVDGFNPCAMWVLVFLLSVLVNIRDRRKIIAIAGTFVLVSGLAYFAFMAAWLNLFLLIGIARPVQIALGVMALTIGLINVKDFVAFKKGVSLSIPESSKPGLYRRVREIVSSKYMTAAIAGAVALAIIVNMIELLCTAGLPALYTQVLTVQQLPVWENYMFLGLYISAYMFDDALLLGVVVLTLSHRRMQQREGQWLKLLSGLVILVLGLVMIFRPAWLQLGH